MSRSERDLQCPRSVEAAAFVLGALGDEEPEYRAHLAGCAICQTEVAELRRVTEAVPRSGPPAVVSDELRERVMAIVRAEAKLLKGAAPGADQAPRRRRKWLLRARPLVGAVALATAAVIAVLIVNPSSQVVRAISARVAYLAPGAHVVLREVGDRGELILSGMPQAPPGKTYEVWERKASQRPMPTDSLFTISTGGRGEVDVPGSLSGVREVLVSAEPLGGSSRLTGPVVIRVRVRS